MKIEISEKDLFLLLSSAMRYSLGRRSYITGFTAELIAKHVKHLKRHSIDSIYSELQLNLELAKAQGTTLGMQMDHDEWEALAEILKEALNA